MISRKSLIGSLAIASAVLVAPTLGTAATDGNLGPTSVGKMDMFINKSSSVRISGLADQNFGSADFLGADEVRTNNFCVFSSTGGYRLTVTGGSGVNNFAMPSGSNDLPFQIMLDGGQGSTPVFPGNTIGGLSGDTSGPACSGTGGANTEMNIIISASDFNAVPPGTYGTTLTFEVVPE